MKPFPLLALALAACASTNVYRDTWQPLTVESDHAGRLVRDALLVEHEPEQKALESVGATLLGYHQASQGWARRAGSTGGTHFVPVELTSPREDTRCKQVTDGLRCTSEPKRGGWTRIAVYRVAPDRWHLLPPYLVPPESTLASGVEPSAVRTECRVDGSLGIAKCAPSWRIEKP